MRKVLYKCTYYVSLCILRVQNIVQSVETSRTESFVWIIVPAVWRRTSKLCGSTATLQDTVCPATPTVHCREWTHVTHTSTLTTHTMRRISHRALLCFSCTVMDERGCPVDTRTGWDTLYPVTVVSSFLSRLNWTNSILFEESELCWTVRLCLDRVQPSRLQWVGWSSSSSCWLCWSSTWGDRRSWRGRKQWGGSCKNTRWAQILMFYHLLDVKRKT